ncbi:MAG: hypothetical protein ACK4I8_02705 [Armatimonadota bacterium]
MSVQVKAEDEIVCQESKGKPKVDGFLKVHYIVHLFNDLRLRLP